MNKYQEKQEEIRQEAIDWQTTIANKTLTESEICEAYWYFYEKAKRYGLVREFKENAII